MTQLMDLGIPWNTLFSIFFKPMSSFGAKDWGHATLMIKVPHKHFDLVVYTTRHFHFCRRDCVASIHERSWKQVWHSRVPWMKHPHCVLAGLRWHWGLEHVRFRRMPWKAAGGLVHAPLSVFFEQPCRSRLRLDGGKHGHQICTDIQRFYWFDWHLLTHTVARGRAKKQIQCPRADLISVKARAAIGHVPFFNFGFASFVVFQTQNAGNQKNPKASKSVHPFAITRIPTYPAPLLWSRWISQHMSSTTHVAELASCLQAHVFSTHFIFHDILQHLCPNSPSKCFNFRRSGQGWCMSTLLQSKLFQRQAPS